MWIPLGLQSSARTRRSLQLATTLFSPKQTGGAPADLAADGSAWFRVGSCAQAPRAHREHGVNSARVTAVTRTTGRPPRATAPASACPRRHATPPRRHPVPGFTDLARVACTPQLLCDVEAACAGRLTCLRAVTAIKWNASYRYWMVCVICSTL